jgi:hypothetical protein
MAYSSTCIYSYSWHVTQKCRLAFNGLHDVISQKTEFFISDSRPAETLETQFANLQLCTRYSADKHGAMPRLTDFDDAFLKLVAPRQMLTSPEFQCTLSRSSRWLMGLKHTKQVKLKLDLTKMWHFLHNRRDIITLLDIWGLVRDRMITRWRQVIFTFGITSLTSRGKMDERENQEVGMRERTGKKWRREGNTEGSKWMNEWTNVWK